MQNRKLRILHIAAHLGEGVGKAVGGIALRDAVCSHEIILLETPLKTRYVDECRAKGANVYIAPARYEFAKMVSNADIVVLNWWNHPLTGLFLSMMPEIPVRLILWCHVNGIYYPRLPAKFVDCFDGCLFTSPVSLEVPYWSTDERKRIATKSAIVYGLGHFNPEGQLCKKDYSLCRPVRIGYVGTLDYAKLHPDFLQYCLAVLKRGVKAEFYLAGEPSDALIESIEKLNLENKIKLLGYRNDILDLLPTFDIFGYLLNPNNFATTENALLEAMAAGLPIITSDGMAEKAIVSDGENGFLVSDPNEYADKVVELLENAETRKRLGLRARESVCNKYTSEVNLSKFHQSIQKVVEKEKRVHDFSGVRGQSASDMFIYFCPPRAQDIFKDILTDTTDKYKSLEAKIKELGAVFKTDKKGSPLQFLKYYPNDGNLKKICEMLR
ncbi:MAG: glycosyltransferase [Selenomonadaceae bacterium]|nr:glycosyltransferase [Selenomonadaceae bacterium]